MVIGMGDVWFRDKLLIQLKEPNYEFVAYFAESYVNCC